MIGKEVPCKAHTCAVPGRIDRNNGMGSNTVFAEGFLGGRNWISKQLLFGGSYTGNAYRATVHYMNIYFVPIDSANVCASEKTI